MGRQVQVNDLRKSGRCIIDSCELADELWRRVQPHVPIVAPGVRGAWRAVGLNERLRFLKYEPGDYFGPHQDGCYQHEDGPRKGERSFVTVMLYLNEPAEGGGTRFLQTRGGRQQHRFTEVTPRSGLVRLFEHPLSTRVPRSSGG